MILTLLQIPNIAEIVVPQKSIRLINFHLNHQQDFT